MNTQSDERIDEVAPKYEPANLLDSICGWLYYVLVALSLLNLFPKSFDDCTNDILKISFLTLSISLFFGFLFGKLYLIPSAERVRRKQLLADAFGEALTPEKTKAYYNNAFEHSHHRLAANVMENAFFGKNVSKMMLFGVRIKTFGYLSVWLLLLTMRQPSLDLVMWITQIVFSVDILAYWLSLECLRLRHERVFEDLYNYFLHQPINDKATAIASILDAFVSYETAKSEAGVLLDSSVFFRENKRLSNEWITICSKLNIPTKSSN